MLKVLCKLKVFITLNDKLTQKPSKIFNCNSTDTALPQELLEAHVADLISTVEAPLTLVLSLQLYLDPPSYVNDE